MLESRWLPLHQSAGSTIYSDGDQVNYLHTNICCTLWNTCGKSNANFICLQLESRDSISSHRVDEFAVPTTAVQQITRQTVLDMDAANETRHDFIFGHQLNQLGTWKNRSLTYHNMLGKQVIDLEWRVGSNEEGIPDLIRQVKALKKENTDSKAWADTIGN